MFTNVMDCHSYNIEKQSYAASGKNVRPGLTTLLSLAGCFISLMAVALPHNAVAQQSGSLLNIPFSQTPAAQAIGRNTASGKTDGSNVGAARGSGGTSIPSSSEDSAEQSARFLIVSRHTAQIASQLPGEVDTIAFDAGETFAKGDVLARLDCRMIEAEQTVASVEAKAAKTRFENKKELVQRGSASLMEIDLAKLDIEKANSYLKVANVRESLCAIKAPFSGAVRQRLVAEHEFVQTGQPIIEIVDTESLEIEAVVPSHWLSWLKPGHAVELTIEETGARHSAKVARIEPHIDPVSQSVRLWGKITDKSGQSGLLPGMSGIAVFANGS